jgi:sec-independent protein translocase protein TatA
MFRNPLTDSIVALVVLLVIFGPKRLPLLGRSLGQGVREFKDSITGQSIPEDSEQPALMPAQATPTASAQAASPVQAPSRQ